MNLPANRFSAGKITPLLAAFAKRMEDTTHPTQWPVAEKPTVAEALGKGIQSILIGEKTPAQVAEEVETLKRQESR